MGFFRKRPRIKVRFGSPVWLAVSLLFAGIINGLLFTITYDSATGGLAFGLSDEICGIIAFMLLLLAIGLAALGIRDKNPEFLLFACVAVMATLITSSFILGAVALVIIMARGFEG